MPATVSTEAELLEVFSSIQGEGVLVGCRQIFIRLAGCNLACAYCDTPFAPKPECRLEDAPGSEVFRGIPNPIPLEILYNILFQWQELLPGVHHSISLTGGEPLLQAAVLSEWLPVLRRLLPIQLETNGTLPEALPSLLPYLDHIAMDIKLASATGAPTPWEAHRLFLTLARERDCQVKIVVGEETPTAEVEGAAHLLREIAPAVPLILQPVTVKGEITISGQALLQLQTAAGRIHPPTRVIPQTHRFLGVA
jgi:organic radical activating enzyme